MSTGNYDEVPARSKALQRSSPSASVYSRPSNESSPELRPKPYILSSGTIRLYRGRTMTKYSAQHNPASRSISVQRTDPSSFEFSHYAWRERWMSRDLTADPEEVLDYLLEPCPRENVRTMTEILHPANTFGSSVDTSGFGGHRDTFAILGLRRIPHSTELPIGFFRRLIGYIDFETYLSVRLCCRGWSKAISHARPLQTPVVSILPTEILTQIYTYLSPADFNAARHTCRLWMSASLEWRLLIEMLKRGGWWAAVEADMKIDELLGTDRLTLSDEWLLSKRLSTECSLLPDWTGDGLKQALAIRTYDNQSSLAFGRHEVTSLTLAYEVDFSELCHVYSGMGAHQYSVALGFTVSVYNKFLLVHADCMIYVYSLENKAVFTVAHKGSYLDFLTSISCPYPVIAVSMDTSHERYAVAALLAGRMGLVCGLYDDVARKKRQLPTPWNPMLFRPEKWDGKHGDPPRSRTHRADPKKDPSIAKDKSIKCASQGTTGSSAAATRRSDAFTSTVPRSPPLGVCRRLISNICSPESPPTSIAICPRRRCLAFGSATGIELYWIDALRGQYLDRWLPITNDSDILYFMPQRRGIDSARQLRLLTSTKNPDSKEAVAYRQFLSRTRVEEEAQGRGRPDFDQAVPLSDGTHLLFTCPGSGELSFGREAPPDGSGRTKLIMKALLLGPRDAQGRATVPKVYKAAAEMRWGVRVVVGYVDAVWLFSIPPDSFFAFGKECELHEGEDDEDKKNVWPLKIRGIEIGSVPGLSEVAIDAEGGGLTIWAFGTEGKARMYQLGDGRDHGVVKRVVLRTGEVINEKDIDGDVHMHGTEEEATSQDSSGFPSPNSNFSSATGDTQTTPLDEETPSFFFHAAGPLPLLPINDDSDTLMVDAPPFVSEEDEGYVSDEERPDTPMPGFMVPYSSYEDDYGEDEDEGYVSAEEGYEAEGDELKRTAEENGKWVPEYQRAREGQGVRFGKEEDGSGEGVVGYWTGGVEVEVLGGS